MITEVNVSKNEMSDTQRCRKQVIGYQKYLIYNFLILKRFYHVSTVLRLKTFFLFFLPISWILPLHSQLWKFLAFQTI